MINWKKIILFLVVCAALVAVHFSGIGKYASLENLQENKMMLQQQVQEKYLFSAGAFIGTYIIAVGLSIPGATILTLAGGFLFGTILGALYVNVGATLGATVVFLLARYLLGEWVQKKYKKELHTFNKEIEKNGKNYLLTLRFIPLFPFFLINILAGVTTIPLFTFIWTTSLGIIPGSIVYAYAGTQLATINKVSDIFTKEIFIAFTLLGLLVLIPALIRKFKRK